jgi:glycosyltransferase involved in cell wall biosynthesis
MRLFALLRTEHYDVIEVKDKFISGVLALIAARLFSKRFVYWLSYPFPEDYLYRATQPGRYRFLYWIRGMVFKILLYRVLLPKADHIFVQSERMLRDVAAEGVPFDKMTAVPMGVEVDDGRDALPTPRAVIGPDERSILYLGTLAKSRQIDFLFRVLIKVRIDVPGAKLHIVGRADDPSDEEFLVAEVRKLGLDDAVVFVGQLPRPEALAYVREADVCVSSVPPSPMFRAASPTKLVEYMAMGKAVVASDLPEQRLVIEQSGAGYCVPWDEQEFARAIVALLNAPALAAEMGERGRRYVVEHRSYNKIADAVEKTLLALVNCSVSS